MLTLGRDASSAASLDASVVIPTFNRKAVLLRTLDVLARVDYPVNRWEVVVVDDGSDDGTVDAVSAWTAGSDLQVICLSRENAGPAAARNRGVEAARGHVVIFIDNDIEVPPRFVRDHVQTLASWPGCWVIGRIVHSADLRKTPFGRYRDDLWERFHAGHSADQISETHGMTAANLSMSRQDVLRLGGFDPSFTIASCEDWELGLRARRCGIRVLYNPGIVVVHNDWAVTLDQFCERQRLYSMSDVLLWHKYGEQSPRERLVRENSPTTWTEDCPRLVLKKTVKHLLATRSGQTVVRRACAAAERVTPDSRLTRRLYELAVGVAIFRGVREGLANYCEASAASEGGLMKPGGRTRAWGRRS